MEVCEAIHSALEGCRDFRSSVDGSSTGTRVPWMWVLIIYDYFIAKLCSA
jgi:hypothetical protein